MQNFRTHWSDTTNPHEIDDRPAHKRYYLLKDEKEKWHPLTNPIITDYPAETPPPTDESQELQSEEKSIFLPNDNDHDQDEVCCICGPFLFVFYWQFYW